MRRSGKLGVTAALGAVVVLVGLAAIAVAYFTSKGSGTGTATVGTTSPTVTITGTVEGALYPGGTPGKVKLTIKNNESASAYVRTVTLKKVEASDAECPTGVPADFEMPTVAVNKSIAAKGSTTAEGELKMNNAEVNQDPCQGATLTLTFEST